VFTDQDGSDATGIGEGTFILIGGRSVFQKYLFLPAVIFIVAFSVAAPTLGGNPMELSSSAFKDGSKIPAKYAMPAAGGHNVSIPLSWKNAPEGTKSFALLIIDRNPVAKNWVHWMVINIPANTLSLSEGASGKNMPPGAIELKNSYGKTGYGGPQPPKRTGDHPYVVTLYALGVEHLDPISNADLSAFKKAMEGKVLAESTITGHYEQQ
jgi:Raf kinase inhibitor-like YbhB/YbcL family protein